MDKRIRDESQKLRQLSSENAATWLLDTYPATGAETGIAIKLIAHRSWKREDQMRLAEHYLESLPHASGVGYEAFSKIMSVKNLINVLRKYLHTKTRSIDTLRYYLEPVLRTSAKNASDEKLVEQFISELEEFEGRLQQQTCRESDSKRT